MNTSIEPFLAFFIIMAFYMLSSIIRLINAKFKVLHKKIDAIISEQDILYPNDKDIPKKAIIAINQGNRCLANDIIIKHTLCTKEQSEVAIKRLEKSTNDFS